jgi:glycosyltransferase involved in cell wall biosynthesis
MERQLIEDVDEIIAVSDTLRQRISAMGRPSHLLTHGIDPKPWRVDGEVESPKCVEGLERPLIVFWGVVDRRMDAAWVCRLADSMTQGTIVFAGPHDNPEPELLRAPRSVFVGSILFSDLPALARAASVLIMPYRDIPVTRAIQPLKLKEYLATGQPVVVRDLPATRDWEDSLDSVDTADAFVEAVHERVRSGLPDHQRTARQRLANETWEAKASQFESWIDAEPAIAESGRA